MNWKDLLRRVDRVGDAGEPTPVDSEEGATVAPPVDAPIDTLGPPNWAERAAPATEPPDLEWWWSIEHHGHPAFYLRTLMPGDFAPGRLPAPRHVRLLERGEGLPTEVRCGTCGEVPRSEDLEPVERQTGHRGFLDVFRSGRVRWPPPTKPESCWMCSGQAPATSRACLRGTDVLVCAGCSKHLDRRT